MPFRFALQLIMAASLAIASQAGHAQPVRAAVATADFAPLVDHHQHLLSPAAAARVNRPLLPEIKVPASIAQILKQRADDTSDAAKLAPLYTRDALMLGATGKGGWVRGRDKVAQIILTGGAAQTLDEAVVQRIAALLLSPGGALPLVQVDRRYEIWVGGITWAVPKTTSTKDRKSTRLNSSQTCALPIL